MSFHNEFATAVRTESVASASFPNELGEREGCNELAVPMIVSVDIFPPNTVGGVETRGGAETRGGVGPGAVGLVQRHRFAGRPQLIGDMFAEQERRGPQLIGDMFAEQEGRYAG